MDIDSKQKNVSKEKKVLKRICAMVNVRIGDDATIDCSRVIASKLESLGATIVKRFTPKLTHLVIHDYNSDWKARIVKWQQIIKSKSILNLHIVSPLWVQACLTSNSHEEETKFFPVSCEVKPNVDNNLRPKSIQLSRSRKQKRRLSMESVSFTESRQILGKCPQRSVGTDTAKTDCSAEINDGKSHEMLKKEVEREAERLIREARIRRRMTIAGEFISSAESAFGKRGLQDNFHPRKVATMDSSEKASDPAAQNERSSGLNERDFKTSDKASVMVGTKTSDTASTRMSGPGEQIKTQRGKNTLKEDNPSQFSQQSRFIISMSAIEPADRVTLEKAINSVDSVYANVQGYRKTRVIRSSEVSVPFTHLIIGKDTRRTLKVLFGLARGAWILSDAWILASLSSGRWLPERDFEVEVYRGKEQRPSCQIFANLKFFVGSNVAPSRKTLQTLIQCAGGEVGICLSFATCFELPSSIQISNQIIKANYSVCEDGSFSRRLRNTSSLVVTGKVRVDFSDVDDVSLINVSVGL